MNANLSALLFDVIASACFEQYGNCTIIWQPRKQKRPRVGAAFSAKQLVRRIQNQLFTTFIL